MSSDSKTRRAFLIVAWCVWLVGPVTLMLDAMTLQPTVDDGALHSPPKAPDLPYAVLANAVALVVLLVAASRWEGWRFRHFWWLLGYFCLLGVLTVLRPCLREEWPALTVVAVVVYLALVVCALALPAGGFVALIKDMDRAWREAVAAEAKRGSGDREGE